MTDWRRAEWQYWANRIAVWSLCLLFIAEASEVRYALGHHFPWWDDFLEIIEIPMLGVCWFVKRHTDMYRWDV